MILKFHYITIITFAWDHYHILKLYLMKAQTAFLPQFFLYMIEVVNSTSLVQTVQRRHFITKYRNTDLKQVVSYKRKEQNLKHGITL